jgi:hypothetical protein
MNERKQREKKGIFLSFVVLSLSLALQRKNRDVAHDARRRVAIERRVVGLQNDVRERQSAQRLAFDAQALKHREENERERRRLVTESERDMSSIVKLFE